MAQTFLNLSQGVTGTLPTSNYVDGSGLVHITTGVASANSSFFVNNCFNSTYQNYMIIAQNLRITSDGDIKMRLQASETAVDNSYRYAGLVLRHNGTESHYYSSGNSAAWIIGKNVDGNDGASDLFGTYFLSMPNKNTINRKRITGTYTFAHEGGNSQAGTSNFGGDLEVASYSATGLQLLCEAGTFRAGSSSNGHGIVKIYGIVDS